jgi:hypothetical protein
MPITFDAANAAPDNEDYLSAIRWLIQDTDDASAEVADAAITAHYIFTNADDPQIVRNYETAVKIAQALERKYRKQATFSSGGTSVNLRERAESWGVAVSDLMAELHAERMKAEGLSGGVLYAGRGPLYDDGSGLW